MFFIFGWNKPEVSNYGPVYQHTCPNCKNSEYWQLQKVAHYFTLFFIPIFPHDSKFFYYCPVCNRGVELESGKAKYYKAIAEANTRFIEKKIGEAECRLQIEAAEASLAELEKRTSVKQLDEAEDFRATVALKTDVELNEIMNLNPGNYNPAFLIAVREELERRGQLTAQQEEDW